MFMYIYVFLILHQQNSITFAGQGRDEDWAGQKGVIEEDQPAASQELNSESLKILFTPGHF